MNRTKGKRVAYVTTLQHGCVMFAIMADNPRILHDAFISITGGKVYFDASLIDRVIVTPSNMKKPKEVSK